MGLGDWLADKFYRAKDWIEDRVDDIKDFFGLSRRSSYTGSVSETVDVDKVLNKFKDLLSKMATEWEMQSISDVADRFEQFVQENAAKFPELAGEVNRRKSEVPEKMQGTMMEQEKCQQKYTEQFLQEAKKEFQKKLQLEMDRLYDDVSKNIRKYLDEKTMKLEEQEKSYAQLQHKVENGQLNLKELEDACIPAMDAERCMKESFQTGAVI